MKTIKLMSFLFAAGTLFIGCSDDDNDIPEQVNQEEVVTTMNVALTAPSGDVITFKSYDSDGDGPNAPVVTVSGSLAVNTIYNGKVELLNESNLADVKNTTLEIKGEADEHQFFYSKSEALNASFAYADTEGSYPPLTGSDPVGIEFTLSTADTSTGTVSITLIHQPEKDASGVSQGDISNAGGETDFTATFPVTVE